MFFKSARLRKRVVSDTFKSLAKSVGFPVALRLMKKSIRLKRLKQSTAFMLNVFLVNIVIDKRSVYHPQYKGRKCSFSIFQKINQKVHSDQHSEEVGTLVCQKLESNKQA